MTTPSQPNRHGAQDAADLIRSVALSSARLWEEVLERLGRVERAQTELASIVYRIQAELPAPHTGHGDAESANALTQPGTRPAIDSGSSWSHHRDEASFVDGAVVIDEANTGSFLSPPPPPSGFSAGSEAPMWPAASGFEGGHESSTLPPPPPGFAPSSADPFGDLFAATSVDQPDATSRAADTPPPPPPGFAAPSEPVDVDAAPFGAPAPPPPGFGPVAVSATPSLPPPPVGFAAPIDLATPSDGAANSPHWPTTPSEFTSESDAPLPPSSAFSSGTHDSVPLPPPGYAGAVDLPPPPPGFAGPEVVMPPPPGFGTAPVGSPPPPPPGFGNFEHSAAADGGAPQPAEESGLAPPPSYGLLQRAPSGPQGFDVSDLSGPDAIGGQFAPNTPADQAPTPPSAPGFAEPAAAGGEPPPITPDFFARAGRKRH